MTIFRRLRAILPGGRPAPRPVRVVTDSTVDLSQEFAREWEITVVPLHVTFGEESFRDGIDLESEEFFRRLPEAKEMPRSSQPSVGEFQSVYEELAETTDQILSIHLSSRFSGTMESARQAARALAGRCTVEVIDSTTVSMAMGLAVLAAARAAREGGELDACAEAARSTLRRLRLAITMDTLEYLRRGGRIGRAAAFFGGILRIKPILTVRDGEAYPLGRVRTRRKALEELLSISLDGGAIVEAAVLHATTPEDAQLLSEEVSRRFPEVTVHRGRFGPVLGVHGGPGLIGIAVVLAEEPASDNSDGAPSDEQEDA